MALNFGTANGTRYHTTNMKPEADEQIDALWGQNLLDNYAFVWAKPEKVFEFGPSVLQLDGATESVGTIRGTSLFYYHGPRSRLDGTANININELALTWGSCYLYVDGTMALEKGLGAETGDVKKGFTFNCSHLGTNAYYDVSMLFAAEKGIGGFNTINTTIYGFLR